MALLESGAALAMRDTRFSLVARSIDDSQVPS